MSFTSYEQRSPYYTMEDVYRDEVRKTKRKVRELERELRESNGAIQRASINTRRLEKQVQELLSENTQARELKAAMKKFMEGDTTTYTHERSHWHIRL